MGSVHWNNDNSRDPVKWPYAWNICAVGLGEGIEVETAEVAMVPQTEVRVEGSQGKQVIRLIDLLEDHDDIQQVWTNADIDESLYEEEE